MNSFISRLLHWNVKTEDEKALARYHLNSLISSAMAAWPFHLCDLLSYFHSDKHASGHHYYGFTYQELFRPYKYQRIKLLEIGIGGGGYGPPTGGASLLAWKAFFPFGKIVGCDIKIKSELAASRTRIYQIDQSSEEHLAMLREREGDFDIVIDDGSHLSAHQIFTFEHMIDAVKDGGLYIIEDVQTSYWPTEAFGTTWDGFPIGDPSFGRTCMGYFTELSKYLNYAEFLDRSGVEATHLALAKKVRRIAFEHNMIIIHKGRNDDPSNWSGAGGSAGAASP